MRLVWMLVYGVVGAIALGAAVFMGGFALAWILGPDAASALGMLVPMVLTPAAALLGAFLGARKAYRTA